MLSKGPLRVGLIDDTSLALASQIVGFVSFAITIMTLLAIFRSLPRTYLNHAQRRYLDPHHARQPVPGARGREGACKTSHPRRRQVRRLPQRATPTGSTETKTAGGGATLKSNLNDLWQQFKNVERAFLIRDPFRTEQVQKGDYWGESDVDEKAYARPGGGRSGERSVKNFKDRMGMARRCCRRISSGIAELAWSIGLSVRLPVTKLEIGTDPRVARWQGQTSVVHMLDQVHRVQIRRMERDVFETDELVKRIWQRINRRGGGGGGRSGSASSSRTPSGDGGGEGGGGGRMAGIRKRSIRSRPGSVRHLSRHASTTGGHFREVEEREVVRVPPDNILRPREGEASNTGRQRETSPPASRVEYEVVKPGRIYVDVDVDVDRGRPRVEDVELDCIDRARPGQTQGYSRDRGRYR
ncbi:hypothetical protein A1O1_09218 [Capronia coronata CBS 617.96]|uniref:Uncharacterized protein n=1 Tax=Capronia coronata CBS 617.96 TaxID=1182541 RepID=W9XPB5_9EURO|nr:uncharacterized protein A1O1_09218 [Capronia coronata CBS 617.96]EXJ78816.1 hypothetical protein A1O1_09218 [Capronia coronata CBS 617.96]